MTETKIPEFVNRALIEAERGTNELAKAVQFLRDIGASKVEDRPDDLAFWLDTLQQCHAEAKKQSTAINDLVTELKFTRIPAMFEGIGIDSAKITGLGMTLGVTDDVTVKIVESDDFMDWLAGEGETGLVKESIHAGTLKAWVKARLKAGLELPGIEIMTVKGTSSASLRKS